MDRSGSSLTVLNRGNGIRFLLIGLILVLIGCGAPPEVPTAMEAAELTERIPFIFDGTIEKVGRATERELGLSGRVARVKVNRVLKVPAALGDYRGHTITILLGKPYRAPAGEQRLWFTTGLRYGHDLVVREIASVIHRPATRDFRQLVERRIEELPDLLLKRYLAQADLIVVGLVTDVRKPQRLRQSQTPLSEHNPQWREAILAVESVEQGELDRKQVTILFPSSRDVMWIQVPKLRVNQEAVWILHETQIPEESGGTIFTVKHLADVRPKSELARIRKLIDER